MYFGKICLMGVVEEATFGPLRNDGRPASSMARKVPREHKEYLRPLKAISVTCGLDVQSVWARRNYY